MCIFVSSLMSAIKCDSLPPPQNGIVTYSTPLSDNKIAWNESATFSCSPGYALEGDKTRTCFYSKNKDAFGQWTQGIGQRCVGEFLIWASKDRNCSLPFVLWGIFLKITSCFVIIFLLLVSRMKPGYTRCPTAYVYEPSHEKSG